MLLRPVRRRTELVAAAIAARAQVVIGRALLLVAQHLVGFVDGLELVLGTGLLADVRVVLARELAIRGLDLGLVRIGLDAQGFVVVLEFHWKAFRQREVLQSRSPRAQAPSLKREPESKEPLRFDSARCASAVYAELVEAPNANGKEDSPQRKKPATIGGRRLSSYANGLTVIASLARPDLDLARRGFRPLRDGDLQHAVLAGGADAFRVGAVGQRKAAMEHAMRTLDAGEVALGFGVFGLALAADGQDALVHVDLDILGIHAGDVGVNHEAPVFL